MAALHIVIGIVRDAAGKILIARRREDAHQGGLWEFPGGKVEQGESPQQALARELHEELGIEVLGDPARLLETCHDYEDRSVKLEVWLVTAFSGEARPREGQPLRWVTGAELDDYRFPAANHAILEACRAL